MTHTISIDKSQIQSAIEILQQYNSFYKEFDYFVQFKINGVNINIYNSGSIVFQGKIIPDDLFGLIKLINSDDFIGIGIDESGKGDVFGGIVVVASFVKKEYYQILKKNLIVDSKRLNDKKIIDIYNNISNLVDFEIANLMPYEFNTLYEKYNNINILLADLFYQVGSKLSNKTGEKKIICDQFSQNKTLLAQKFQHYDLIQEHYADKIYKPVSISSIIARYFFLEQLNRLKKKYPNIKFLKGANFSKQILLDFIKNYGEEELINVSKINFKTVKSIIYVS